MTSNSITTGTAGKPAYVCNLAERQPASPVRPGGPLVFRFWCRAVSAPLHEGVSRVADIYHELNPAPLFEFEFLHSQHLACAATYPLFSHRSLLTTPCSLSLCSLSSSSARTSGWGSPPLFLTCKQS